MNRASPPHGAARAAIPLGRDAAGRIIAIDCLRIRGRYSSAVTSRAGSRPCRRRPRPLFAAINANVRKSPFGGVGGRGTGCYRFDAGFRAFSHYRSVMAKPYWFEAPVKYPSVARLRRRLRAPAVQALPLDLLSPPRDRRPLRRRGRSRRFHDQVDLRPSRHRRVRALPRAAPRARWVRDHDGRRDGLAAAESDRLPRRRHTGANEPAEGDRSLGPLGLRPGADCRAVPVTVPLIMVSARRCDRVLATLAGRGPVRISPDLNHHVHCDLADPAEPAPGEASQRGGASASPRSAHSSAMGHASMPTP